MKMKIKRIFLLSLIVLTASAASGCEKRLGAVKEFQLWSGNVTLPPEYQKELIIRGKIDGESVSIDYSRRAGEEEPRKKTFKLTGADFRKCMQMLENTELEEAEMRAGASAFDVTLIDETGAKKTGTPSNREEWSNFSREIEAKSD